MKRLLSIFAAVLLTAGVFAQAPQKMSYQAVIRNTSGLLITSTQIGMEINIRQGSPTGTIVYSETQNPKTNANGLVSIEIGGGAGFSAIDWGSDTYFLETKTAVVPPLTTYTITGVSQLLSVPYALHAKTAETITGKITETDPIYSGSKAAKITEADITKLSNLLGTNTGDQDLSGLATKVALADSTAKVRSEIPDVSGFLTTETDPTYTSSAAAKISATDITKLGNLSGINTGDQDLSALATKIALADSTAKVRSEIPDVSGFLTTETDPTYTSSAAAKITATDITKLSNLSGTNTGDQDLSGLVTTTSVTTGLATKVDKEAGKGLSTNDYTTAEQSKLAGITTGAEVNVNADWNATSGDAQILNKPAIPSAQDLVKLSNLSGVNTGDQDLSGLATTTSVTTGLAAKVDKEAGKGLSTNDYTTAEQTKLAGIATGAEVNVNADWNATSGDAQILNKPTIPSAQDLVKLSNLSGVNTGDQDLSGLATTTSVTTGLAAKVDKEAGKGLSTNDYTTAEQTKLAGIATGAEVNVNADWNATSGDAQILNKPAIPSASDLVKLSNLSGVNTGDQDLSGLATTTSVTTGLATKVDKEAGKGLSTNDYTTAEQTKLAGIATGAEVNVNADWNATSGDAQILNKPAIPSAQDLVKLSNLSGVNTGDQDLSGLATTTSVTTGLAAKVDKEAGKGLSTNDYTTAEQTKLAGIATGAEVNVNADWNATSGDAQILNKPTIPSAADLVKLSNLSGVNTGDQDLSGLATKTALADSTAKVRSEIPNVPKGTQVGQMQYWNGTAWVTVAPATGNGQILYFINNKPQWGGPALAENEVMSPGTGRIWMDRNLGASQVATSSSDANAFGDLYQWGRAADGHQIRTSTTVGILSTTDTPGHSNYITNNTYPNDWRTPSNDNLWQIVNGTNNPCPSGYRIPTKAEWEAEIATWSSQDAAGAFASSLKLPAAGGRNYQGGLFGVGSSNFYWSSTVESPLAKALNFTNTKATIYTGMRGYGFSVRCIKE